MPWRMSVHLISVLFPFARSSALGTDGQDGVGQPTPTLPAPEARLPPTSPHKHTRLRPPPKSYGVPTLCTIITYIRAPPPPPRPPRILLALLLLLVLLLYGQSAGGPSGMKTWIPSKSLVSFTCTVLGLSWVKSRSDSAQARSNRHQAGRPPF